MINLNRRQAVQATGAGLVLAAFPSIAMAGSNELADLRKAVDDLALDMRAQDPSVVSGAEWALLQYFADELETIVHGKPLASGGSRFHNFEPLHVTRMPEAERSRVIAKIDPDYIRLGRG